MSADLSYYIANEMKFRVKTSAMLWIYLGVVSLVGLLYVLLTVVIQQVDYSKSTLRTLQALLLLFFPLTMDTFDREVQLNMVDYLVMAPTSFRNIFFSRIIANAVLLTVPGVIVEISIIMAQTSFLGVLELTIFVNLIIIFLFLYSWFLISTLILLVIQLRVSDSLTSVFLYLGIIFGLLGSLLLINPVAEFFNPFSFLTGYSLFENPLLAVFFGGMICLLANKILLLTINLWISKLLKEREMTTSSSKSQTSFRPDHYSLIKAIFSKTGLSGRGFQLYLCLILLITFGLFLNPPNSSRILLDFVNILGFHFVLIIISVLIIILPQLTGEKEFNMEELLLSRISVFRYFIEKYILLIRNILIPLLVPVILFLMLYILFFSGVETPSVVSNVLRKLIYILILLMFKIGYFVSLLIFLWRVLPAKNLLRSSVLAILGIEILGRIVFPPFAPILSSIFLSSIFTDNEIARQVAITIWFLPLLTFVLFLGSYALIKSEVRFY